MLEYSLFKMLDEFQKARPSREGQCIILLCRCPRRWQCNYYPSNTRLVLGPQDNERRSHQLRSRRQPLLPTPRTATGTGTCTCLILALAGPTVASLGPRSGAHMHTADPFVGTRRLHHHSEAGQQQPAQRPRRLLCLSCFDVWPSIIVLIKGIRALQLPMKLASPMSTSTEAIVTSLPPLS